MKLVNWIENFIYDVSVLSVDELLNFPGIILLGPFLLGLIFILVFPLNLSVKRQLSELNIGTPFLKLKIVRFKNRIEIRGINSSLMEKSYWISKLEVLSNIFSLKFIDVAILKKGTAGVTLYLDTLPVLVSFADNCPTLKPMEIWLGVNQFGNNVVINLQNSSSIYIDGKPGSGKTIAITSVIKSYLIGINSELDLTVVTTKPADYYFLRKYESIKLKLIDPFEGVFSDRVLEVIEDIASLNVMEEDFKNIIENSELLQSTGHNAESLRSLGELQHFPRKFYIFDEAKDYLAKNKADTKEDAESKQKLIAAVYTHIRRTARFLSTPIIIASQTQSEGDLDIPLKTFHLRLASQTNEAMSRIITGDKRLIDSSFRAGKFYLGNESGEHILRVPM